VFAVSPAAHGGVGLGPGVPGAWLLLVGLVLQRYRGTSVLRCLICQALAASCLLCRPVG
jgi:hypothetical protein